MTKEIKIYTRGGDKGKTSLIGGKRIDKSNSQLEAYGNIDELNSSIGLIRSELTDLPEIDNELQKIQNLLFNVGSLLACDSEKSRKLMPQLSEADSVMLENWIDKKSRELPPLKNFILPSGARPAALSQLSRTICRRAERSILTYFKNKKVNSPEILKFINRLSDYLFTLARYINVKSGRKETIWEK